jgi:hypothetical protein
MMHISKSVNLVIVVIISLFLVSILVNTSYARIDPGTIELLLLMDDGKDKIARDSSGNGHDGDITGAQWVDGKFGGALEFDGTADDKIIVGGYFGVGGTDPRTTAFWWKSDDSTSRHSWVKWGVNVASQKYYIRGDDTVAGKITLRVEVNSGQSYGSTNVCDGEWHHLAVVFPNGADSVKDHNLYVDGVLEVNPQGTDFNMDTENKTTDIHIGTQVPGVNQHEFANGIMDELAIFNVALTQDDIKTIMTQGLATVLAVDHIDKMTTTWAMIKTRY